MAANETRRLLKDGHGSTRALVDATGAVISSDGTAQVFAYDAYGVPLGFTLTDALTTHLYSGEQTDQLTGLQYLRARYYNPTTGTFNRLDPFAGNFSDPQSLHRYLYCHAEPVNGWDPSGKMGLGGLMVGFAIGSNLRSLKNEGDMFAFDLACTLFSGIEAGMTVEELLWSFAESQITGLGIGFAIGKVTGVLSEIWENGTVVAPARRTRVAPYATSNEPLVFVNNGRYQSMFRFAADAAVAGRTATRSKGYGAARINTAFRSPVQQQRAQRWVGFATYNRAGDIRLDQLQVDPWGNYQGINRPDIQFTLGPGRYELPNGSVIEIPEGNRRIYIELDTTSSGRGPEHLRRIISNDPRGLTILETTNRQGTLDSLTVGMRTP